MSRDIQQCYVVPTDGDQEFGYTSRSMITDLHPLLLLGCVPFSRRIQHGLFPPRAVKIGHRDP